MRGQNLRRYCMKKFFVCMLSLCMMLTVLSSCGAKDEPSSTSAEPPTQTGLPESYDLIMSMGSETSSTYAMGIQIGEYINTLAPDITCTVKALSLIHI